MEPIGPIPIHLARAYGINRPQPAKPVDQPIKQIAPVRPNQTPTAGVEVRGLSIRPAPTRANLNTEPAIDATRARLVAARVPGRIDFTGTEPVPGASSSESAAGARLVNISPAPAASAQAPLPSGRLGAYSIYRHPADRNAAATGVDLGRILDANA